MEESLISSLKAIVGEESVRSGSDATKPFLRPGQDAPGLTVVSPESSEDVQAIVNLVRENKASIVTCNDLALLAEDLDRKGILMDFSRMNTIERLDNRNLVGHIQRGVTWDQLLTELKKLGLKTTAPIAAESTSPVECIVARGVGKSITKFPDYALMNMKVVLANGNVHKTGTHGLNEDASDGRNDGSANLSQWYVGADDILGIVARASIMLYPICEARSCRIYGFEDVNELMKAMKDVPRTELGVEYLGINRVSMQKLLGGDVKNYAPWSLVVGFEGREKLVAHNEDRANTLLSKYNCQPADEGSMKAMGQMLDEPWMAASQNHSAFYSLFSRMSDLDGMVDSAAQAAGISDDKVGKMLVSVDRGRCVYAVYDWFVDTDCTEAINQMNLSMSDQGAFFDRPHGELARKIYTSIPNHLPVLKHIKGFMDPENILNPGRTIKEEDKEWEPPQIGEGEIGLTVSNVKAVKEKIAEIVGKEWVSDNPVDLSAYGRDFTIFSGERPNILVMPISTEEVQKIIRIAYEHGIPLVPQTTGFNHGGLTISRKGGILVDLRRMDNICSIDEDAMTVTVSPSVRMRSVWWEAVQHNVFEGVHLKPILPLTVASISLLSNYVARGAPGTAAKHGTAMELTTKMTWVLPNGELLELGPGAVPGVGNLPLHYCPGPEITGMFFNADGQFGVCTELTAKLYPEYDNVEEIEELLLANIFEPDEHKAFCIIIDAVYDVSRENITEFMYKGHPGAFALGLSAQMEGVSIKDALAMAPRHPLAMIVSAFDVEELQIKKEILAELMEKHGLMILDPSMFGEEMAGQMSTAPLKKSLGVADNYAGTYKGAFQWTAAQFKMDILPEIALEYEKLVAKYWKTSDASITVAHAMTDTAVQGPLPFGRAGPCEFDYWWDQGNPEEVKRATQMVHKTNKLLLKFGGPLWRNMFGSGEYHLPMYDEYFTVLKQTKQAFDPENLMHPDVLPLTDDYI